MPEKTDKNPLAVVAANLVSLLRVVCGALAALCGWSGRWKLGAWLIVAGITTDGIDGAIARRWNGITKLGADTAEPAADVALAVLPQIALLLRRKTPFWLFGGVMAGNGAFFKALKEAEVGSLEFRLLDTGVGIGYSGSLLYCLVQYARAGEAWMLLRLVAATPLLLIWRRPHTLIRWVNQLDPGYRPALLRAP